MKFLIIAAMALTLLLIGCTNEEKSIMGTPDKLLPSKCTMQGGFSCEQYGVQEGATPLVYFTMKNNLGVDAKDVIVTLTSTNCGGISETKSLFTLSADSTSERLVFTCPSVIGNQFIGSINIQYIRTGEESSRTAVGRITVTQ